MENGHNVDTENAPFIYSAYGALVNHESVCEGYAKAFKAVMDRLDIPCVVVAGYVNNPDKGGYQLHAWNYVQVEGYWYMVDMTNNSPANNNKWLLVGFAAMEDYLEDNVVSTSGYELRYPAVKPYEYGNDTDSNGMLVTGIYDETDGIKTLQLEVSYENKGALVLQQEGKYLAIRYGVGDGKGGIDWQPWMNILVMNEKRKDNVEGDFFVTTDTSTIATQLWYEYFQFALINRAPDSAVDDIFMGDALVSYKQLADDHFAVQPTTPYRNDTYGESEPAPGANHITSHSKTAVYRGVWTVESANLSFGQVYHGKKDSTVTLEFTGTRFAILTSTKYESKFEVWIDGNKVESIDVAQPAGAYGITYISELLTEGKHTVEIKCTGDTYIDFYAIY